MEVVVSPCVEAFVGAVHLIASATAPPPVSTIWVHLQDRKLERKLDRGKETEQLKTTLEPSLSRRERRESSHLPVRRSVHRQRPLGRFGDGE